MSKHTPGPWQISEIHGVCTGVEVDLGGGYSQMIVNTILPDTDKQYAKEKSEIIANAKLIAAAPDLLQFAESYRIKVAAGLTTSDIKMLDRLAETIFVKIYKT